MMDPLVQTRLDNIRKKFNLKSDSDAVKYLLDYYEAKKAEELKSIDLDK